MESSETRKLTQKAILTRQRIMETAWHLFATKGYDQTTMRDIAAVAECSLGLAYRYFASKEDLVLELYRWLVTQLEELVPLLPTASIADRLHQLMHELLIVMAPHRLTLIALSASLLVCPATPWCGGSRCRWFRDGLSKPCSRSTRRSFALDSLLGGSDASQHGHWGALPLRRRIGIRCSSSCSTSSRAVTATRWGRD